MTARSALRAQMWLGSGVALCGLGQIVLAVVGGSVTVLGVIGAVQAPCGASLAFFARRQARELEREPEGQTDGGRAS